MPDLRPVPAVNERISRPEDGDLEAETARKIQLLVARTRMWRKGSMAAAPDVDGSVETAAS
jgi:hypothetical protein